MPRSRQRRCVRVRRRRRSPRSRTGVCRMSKFGRRFSSTTTAATLVSTVATAAVLVIALTGSVTPHAAAASADAGACSAGTLVQTHDGPVCGRTARGVTSYLGIPYAAPPVGRLRWRPPQPPKPWTSTLHATTPVAKCPSPGFPPGAPPMAGTTEDCLQLKVQIPAGAVPGDNLPVMYELHGGGFLGEARTDAGQNLVRSGKVVYVYVAYRL